MSLFMLLILLLSYEKAKIVYSVFNVSTPIISFAWANFLTKKIVGEYLQPLLKSDLGCGLQFSVID